MNSTTAPRLEGWCTLLFLAGLLLLLKLQLLPSLIAGLLVYTLVHAMVPMLRGSVLDHQVSRVVAVTLIASVVIALVTLAGFGLASFLRHSGESVPQLLHRMAEIIEGSRERLPLWLVAYLPDDANELQRAIVEWLQANAAAFRWSAPDSGARSRTS